MFNPFKLKNLASKQDVIPTIIFFAVLLFVTATPLFNWIVSTLFFAACSARLLISGYIKRAFQSGGLTVVYFLVTSAQLDSFEKHSTFAHFFYVMPAVSAVIGCALYFFIIKTGARELDEHLAAANLLGNGTFTKENKIGEFFDHTVVIFDKDTRQLMFADRSRYMIKPFNYVRSFSTRDHGSSRCIQLNVDDLEHPIITIKCSDDSDQTKAFAKLKLLLT